MEKALEGNQALLKGEAEEFVSSWYADIAYKRGCIQADENKDGFLDIQERKILILSLRVLCIAPMVRIFIWAMMSLFKVF